MANIKFIGGIGMKLRKISIMLSLSMSLLLLNDSRVFAATSQKRFGGQNRYGTCTSVLKNNWEAPSKSTGNYAIIVSGDNYPDALSAAPLAKKYSAPIILVSNKVDTPDPGKIDTLVSSELKRLKITDVFIIGGTGAVPTTVENEIKNMEVEGKNINIVKRFAGVNRYDTAVQVANEVGVTEGIVITYGEAFQDALSVSPIAAKLGMPIILVPKAGFDSSTKCVQDFIKGKTIPKTYIIGGTDIISDKVASNFQNVQDRIKGATPYERNINIIDRFKDKLDFSNVFLASGGDYPDGLCAAPLAARTSSPVILVKDNMENSTQSYLAGISSSIKNITIFGGTGAVTSNTENDLLKIINQGSFTVDLIE